MVAIREASLADLDLLVRLRVSFLRELRDLGDEQSVAALAAATRRYLAMKMPGGGLLAWVAEDGGEVVGTGAMALFERPPTDWNLAGLEGYILNCYTLPGQRGKGIATALLDEIVRRGRALGTRRLWLHATEAGRPIYERAAFVPDRAALQLYL